MPSSQKLKDFYHSYTAERNLNGPTFVRKADEVGEYLHIKSPPALAEICAFKMDLTFAELIEGGFLSEETDIIEVTDKNIESRTLVQLTFI